MLNKSIYFIKENLLGEPKVKFEDSKFAKLDNLLFGFTKKNVLYSFLIPGSHFGPPEFPLPVNSGVGKPLDLTIYEKIKPLAQETTAAISKDVGFWEGMQQSLDTIAKVCDYILHPGKLTLLFWNWTVEMSFIVCIGYCLFAVFMYLSGSKKFTKYVPGAVIVYTLIQFLNLFIVG